MSRVSTDDGLDVRIRNATVCNVVIERLRLYDYKQKGHPFRWPFFSLTNQGLVFALVFEGESIGLANAVEHGVDRDCDSPIVQRGVVA